MMKEPSSSLDAIAYLLKGVYFKERVLFDQTVVYFQKVR